jgi:hypothetical protein
MSAFKLTCCFVSFKLKPQKVEQFLDLLKEWSVGVCPKNSDYAKSIYRTEWIKLVGLEGLEPPHRRVMSALPSPFSYRPKENRKVSGPNCKSQMWGNQQSMWAWQ